MTPAPVGCYGLTIKLKKGMQIVMEKFHEERLPTERMPHSMDESMKWLAICMLYEDWEFHLPKDTGMTGPVISAVINWPYEGHPYRRPKAWRHREDGFE